jgi:hypothetical protein
VCKAFGEVVFNDSGASTQPAIVATARTATPKAASEPALRPQERAEFAAAAFREDRRDDAEKTDDRLQHAEDDGAPGDGVRAARLGHRLIRPDAHREADGGDDKSDDDIEKTDFHREISRWIAARL